MATQKYKLPKKPKYKKFPAAPKKIKGGIKTEAQLSAYDKKVTEWSQKCSVIKAENKKLKSEYDKKVSAIEKQKAADKKAKELFKKRLESINKKLHVSCKL